MVIIMATLVNRPGTAGSDASASRLSVTTLRLDGPVDLAQHIPADPSGLFLHRGDGLLARGEALVLTATGEDRFTDLSQAFQQVSAAATVDDAAGVRGSGLLALGSFSYYAASERPSRLVIPRAVLGQADGCAFLTLVTADGEDPARGLGAADGRDPSALLAELFPTADVEASAADAPAPPVPHIEVASAHTPAEYQALISRAVDEIRAGGAEKLVISERLDARSSDPVSIPALARRLAAMYPMTWVFRVGDVIGASPEMLVETEGSRLFSRVLAGTRPVADGGELTAEDRDAFFHDPKERAEHEYAIRSVTGPLEAVTEWISAPAEPFVLRLPGLEHLASDVSAKLRPGLTSVDVAGLLHPSAAVSGTPRADADRINRTIEEQDRGGYAAPVGWMSGRGDGQWAIALRMAHLDPEDPHYLVLQAGGGIVEASDPLTEHAEALAKTRPMMRALRG
nr:chorismate-binding protein [Helcobacillus sp. ACRRO]